MTPKKVRKGKRAERDRDRESEGEHLLKEMNSHSILGGRLVCSKLEGDMFGTIIKILAFSGKLIPRNSCFLGTNFPGYMIPTNYAP